MASWVVGLAVNLAVVCAQSNLSTSSAETVAAPQFTKEWKALGKIGACAETTITKISDRGEKPLSPTPFKLGEKLDEDGEPLMDQGTYVQYQNGAEQIDAEWIAGVAHSKLGDPVRLCTVWKPKKCPPGDDRGRIYKATNLRTKETWQMSESWHSCGGA
ncbi:MULTISPECIES: hypothetical protein [unclassified Bradyrhizobium]|uniref:hypothetical protein n=1 Tax=unclassified Bradyrhizobium TaxID=2631580 RepID=UPI0024E12147|nr:MULTISPECIES: hypothetical protein [unclassified Bradyrhizobium]